VRPVDGQNIAEAGSQGKPAEGIYQLATDAWSTDIPLRPRTSLLRRFAYGRNFTLKQTVGETDRQCRAEPMGDLGEAEP
jgi:hypothetical protein